MQEWETISGRKTHFGKPGSTARLIAYDMEQEERIKQKLERRKKPREEFIPYQKLESLTDEQISSWVEEAFKEVFM